MKRDILTILGITILALVAGTAVASTVTGDPLADGWAYSSNSLQNGTYVRNSANYGFDIYSTVMTVASGSKLNISDGDYSWLAGDTVIGIGGVFADITATEAGWDSFTGNAVNSLLNEGTKFVAKFGTKDATFSASTIAPAAGDGVGSTSASGNGGVFLRSSGWFTASDWSANKGILMLPDKDSHIERVGAANPDKRVARLIWQWDAEKQHVTSWQMLLNTSLLDRLQPGLNIPSIGDYAIASVQYRDSAYTDALVQLTGPTAPVPEPATVGIFGLGLVGLAAMRLRRRAG